jgi:histidinol-phosphatase
MPSDFAPVDRGLLDIAVTVADEAGRLSVAEFFGGGHARLKSDGTEVTDADLAVEELIRGMLSRQLPDDAIVGEEGTDTTGASGRRWIIDPISGTAYFTRRMPLFANLLACHDEYGPAIGVINLPAQGEMVFAGRGLGCWLRSGTGPPTPTRVGPRAALDGALVLAANQHTWTEELLVALHRRVMLAGAIHHAALYLVTGRVDAAVLTHQGVADLAPLPVIVGEAGGRVTDLRGTPVLTGDGSALLSSGPLHDELLRTVAGLPHVRGPKALHRKAGR